MSRWYRAYEGTVTDAKMGEAALVAGCSRSVAIAAWHCILESCATAQRGGEYDTSPRRVAVILGEPIAAISALFDAFIELGMIGNGAVTAWKQRQFESDTSTERSRKHRQRKCNGVATLQQQDEPTPGRDATPPYTETDTHTESEAEQKEDRAAACVEIGKRVTDMMGVTNDPRWLGNWSTVSVWLAQGFDPEFDILPTVAATVDRLKRTGKPMPGSLKYFSRAIEENHKARLATGESPAQKSTREFYSARKGSPQHRAWIDHYRRQGRRMTFYESQDMLTVPTEFPPEEKAA
jgi:hypothetical protein